MYLGLDIGEVRTGIALCEGEPFVAIPLLTVSTDSLLDNLSRISDQQKTKTIVIGLPISLTGTETEQTKFVRYLGAKISNELDIKVEFFDERLTTKQSLHALREAGIPEAQAKHHKDEISAQIILQTYLDTNV